MSTWQMMKKFSLSDKKELPIAVEANGSSFSIRSDFKTILRLLRMSQDADIAEKDKLLTQQKMFFVGNVPPNFNHHLNWFLSCGIEQAEGSGENDFDFELDAQEIYSGFMQVYNIDLFEVDLH